MPRFTKKRKRKTRKTRKTKKTKKTNKKKPTIKKCLFNIKRIKEFDVYNQSRYFIGGRR